jgi:hypothetical protein
VQNIEVILPPKDFEGVSEEKRGQYDEASADSKQSKSLGPD